MNRLAHWIKDNQTLIANSGTLIGTAIVNSGIGFAYWWLAAHWFDQAVVGIASAMVSAMLLLGSVAMMGLGTLLVGEIARRKGEESALLTTSIVTITLVGVVVAVGFALISGTLSIDFAILIEQPAYLALFVLGVALTAITLMLDQAFIGLLKGGVQLTRNFSASVIKLAALAVFGIWLTDQTGMLIFAAWTLGTLLSLVIPLRVAVQVVWAPAAVSLGNGARTRQGGADAPLAQSRARSANSPAARHRDHRADAGTDRESLHRLDAGGVDVLPGAVAHADALRRRIAG